MRRPRLESIDEILRVQMRITDNWLELTVRFPVRDYGVRAVKDVMTREIVANFADAGLGIASITIAIVDTPRISVETVAAK